MTRLPSVLAETAGAMKDAVIGPLINMKAVEKVEARIAAPTLPF
jgi:hypothetical protein